MKRPEGTVFIYFSKFYPDNLLTDLLSLKNWYENQNEFRNIHISFPIFFWKQVQEEEILYFWLSRLIKEETFFYFPNTFSGENHQILNLEEAKVDLSWCLSNPEGTGYRDLFERDPLGIYVTGCDLYRLKMQTLYHKYKDSLILEGLREEKGEKRLLYRQGSIKKAIPLYSFNWRGLIGQVLDFLSPFPSSHYLLYWSNLDQKPLESFLRAIPRKLFREAPLKDNKRLSAGYFINLNPISAESDLSLRSHSFIRQSLRPTLLKPENIANNLRTSFPLPSYSSTLLKGDPQQILEGETRLSSGALELSFKKGQLLSWSHKYKRLPSLPPTRSYSSSPKIRESDYHSTSLQQGCLSGIRQVLFSGEGLSSSLDYLALEKEEGFLINGNFTWSAKALRSTEVQLTPLELPLYRLEKDSLLKVSIINSESESYDRLIPDDELSDVLWGESFFFHHITSPLMFTFLSLEEKIKFPLSLKTRKIKGFYYLFLNIGGFYSPIHLKRENIIHQSFSLLINQPQKMPFSPWKPFDALRHEINPCEIWMEKS